MNELFSYTHTNNEHNFIFLLNFLDLSLERKIKIISTLAVNWCSFPPPFWIFFGGSR